MTPGGPPRPWLLALDTGTSRILVAAGAPDGRMVHALDWPAGYRHGERLLPGVEALMTEARVARADLSGVIVGTGPGAFTGLRVGLATAKALAHQAGIPIAGVGTGDALIRAVVAAGLARLGQVVLLLPAGPHDRVMLRDGEPASLLPGGTEPTMRPADVLVAVDLAGRAPGDAVTRGDAALGGLAAALLAIGAERLRAGDTDDVELLVPEYVTLPRGVRAASGEIEWSRGPR
jgi:tRNA threonylcarbamoyl adenosine modification protein YeaZ